ncbi:hypothetical protein Tco_0112714, partial [Tanacetum coccineum]
MPVIDDEEILILEEESRSKMSKKEKDPKAIKQNISHKHIDYENLNRLTEDFGKRFTPQQELSAEQAFWLRISNPTIESSYTPPVKVEVPSELPKVSLVNESLKKLKFQLAQFDSVVKKRITPDALTEELSKSQNAYKDLLKNYSQLEKHCISLEETIQLNQENFQNDKQCDNPDILKYFEINNLKAQLKDKHCH